MDPDGIYDSRVENETSSDEFVLHPRLPSLQEMTYNKIAIAVWYKYCSTPRQRHYEQCHLLLTAKLELMDCHKLIKTLTMPLIMKEILKKYLKRVCRETILCTEYFRDKLFPTYFDQYRMRQVDWEYFVWRPDGRIDYKSTAIKMLHSSVLTKVQKFAIMCNFCLENEIKNLDLNRRPIKTFISKVNEDRDPLLFYWISYLKNDSHGVTRFLIRSLGHVDLNSMPNDNEYHGVAFEYFLNRLKAEDQVSFISDRLRLTFDRSHWRDSMFYNMSHYQLTTLLLRQPVAVISVFIKNLELPEWAIMAWKRCKNRISNEQFVQLLQSLLGGSNNHRFLRRELKMSVLLEIWNTADDHQKNYAAGQRGLEIAVVYPILAGNSKLAPSSFKFILEFLSSKSADFRKKLILECGLSFIFNFDFHLMHEVFQLCLPHFQDKVEFQNKRSKYVSRPYFCKILYSEEDHDELNRRLLRSFQNLNISSNDVLKKFIESSIAVNKRKCEAYGNDEYDLLIRLSKFINKILQENVSAVLKMKQSYISSFSDNSDPYERYCSLNELSKLIEQEFVHEHLRELKHRLAMKLRTTSVEQWIRYKNDYEKFTGVFSWCFENEEELWQQVKRCIPINNIIGTILEGIADMTSCSFYYLTLHFCHMERFLEWYFSGVADKVISFKLGVMNDPESTKLFEYERQDPKFTQQLRRMFLQWNWPAQRSPCYKKSRHVTTYDIISFTNLP